MSILHKEDPLTKIYFCSDSPQSNMPTVMNYTVFAENLHGADILDTISIGNLCLYGKWVLGHLRWAEKLCLDDWIKSLGNLLSDINATDDIIWISRSQIIF